MNSKEIKEKTNEFYKSLCEAVGTDGLMSKHSRVERYVASEMAKTYKSYKIDNLASVIINGIEPLNVKKIIANFINSYKDEEKLKKEMENQIEKAKAFYQNQPTMSKNELTLLLFLETCAVDYGGRVDSRRMNQTDFDIINDWKKKDYLLFGRIRSKDITTNRSHWVELSDTAWNDAHSERKARFKRINEKRTWNKTDEIL